MKVTLAVFLACCAVGVNSFETSQGPCPTLTPIANFNRARYSGTWNEIRRTSVPLEVGTSCGTPYVSFDSNGALNLRVLAKNDTDGSLFDNTIVAAGTAQNNVFTLNVLNNEGGRLSTLNIIDTDYDTYAVTMACNSLDGLTHATDGWILSRKPQLSDAVVNRAIQTLGRYGVSRGALADVNRNCDQVDKLTQYIMGLQTAYQSLSSRGQ